MTVTCTVLRIPKAEADAEPYRTYLDALCSLSQAWADEHVCPSYSPNAAEDFCERAVYAALDGKEIIGYAMGHKTILTAASSLNAAGETAFVLDELYVRQSCRGKGVGKALFRFMENDVRDDVDVIDLIAASCRHADLLRFYIDELGMTFRYAELSKRTKP